jgi:AraC family transcriptional regulator
MIETGKGHVMDRSITSCESSRVSPTEALAHELPTVYFSPPQNVRQQKGCWHGVDVETVQLISHEDFEYDFRLRRHLLVAVEQGVRYDGETIVEGLPTSTMRNYSSKLILVPAGRRFSGTQSPRLLTRSICVSIDPRAVAVDPDLGFSETELQPRLLFEDSSLWETVLKLKAQIGSVNPGDGLYAEALGGLLAHEFLRLQNAIPASRPGSPAGLARWQQRRIMEFMEEHLAENISLDRLAGLVRLSPYHFLRSFRRSFGQPPHRYWSGRRIERAKALLANPRASVTEIAFDVGFSGTSAFSATFRRTTGQTPTEFRRSLE